ncbi:MAG: IS1380 family transposase [Candidatus Omnitrophica bacterium]|nr:IS1380 family transposase [Candidatus Omnitrophota bacterium]
MKKSKTSIQDQAPTLFDFEIDPEPLSGEVTSHAGLPSVAETFRAIGGMKSVARHLNGKQRDRGYTDAEMAESFLLLLSAGGDHLDDFDLLRGDRGLARLLDHEIPSSSKARQFLYTFHDEELMEQRPDREEQAAWVPEESERLMGLARVNTDAVRSIDKGIEKVSEKGVTRGTIDADATIIDSNKREALWHYKQGRGYQPHLAYWVERDLIVADQFRDGNVPAAMDPLSLAKAAFEALPETVTEFAYRADSASYQHDLLNWLRGENKWDRPRCPVTFAISADMTPQLKAVIEGMEESAWESLKNRDGSEPREEGITREWAEIPFVPEAEGVKKDSKPDRYIAIRVTRHQQLLFDDGNAVRYYAIVTNHEGRGEEAIHWHREKAGTVEYVHDVTKNDLGAGIMPCGRFGANAAWYRLCLLTYNLLSAFKQIGLPEKLHKARPKKLRFRLLCLGAKIATHARKTMLKVAAAVESIGELLVLRSHLPRLLHSG